MFSSERFNELSEDALAFILQSDKLKMDEEDILNRVMEWAAVNSVGVDAWSVRVKKIDVTTRKI